MWIYLFIYILFKESQLEVKVMKISLLGDLYNGDTMKYKR